MVTSGIVQRSLILEVDLAQKLLHVRPVNNNLHSKKGIAYVKGVFM